MKKFIPPLLGFVFLVGCLLPAKAQNVNISNGFVFDGEPYLAIDPANSQHMVIAWMGYSLFQPLGIKTRVTFNGGQTWSSTVILPHFGTGFHSADPSLGFDSQGNVLACYVDFHQNPDSGGVFVEKSTDGGLSWGSPSQVLNIDADGDRLPLDRPWMVIDRINDHVFVTTKPAPWIPPPNRPYLTYSTDDAQSWQSWCYIDTTGYMVGPLVQAPMAAPAISADGTFHCVYPTYLLAQNFLPGFIHASSTDDGAHFTYSPVLYSNSTTSDTLPKLGYRLVFDPQNANRGAFLFLSPTNGDLDVFCARTTDGGANWSNPIRVNDDPVGNGKMQDLVWADYNNSGDLVAGWRDRRNATGTGYATGSEIYGAILYHDSSSFSANFAISDTLAPYNALYLSGSGNDFMNIHLLGDTIRAAWGDVRTGHLNIWYAQKVISQGNVTSLQLIDQQDLPHFQIYPNPAKDRIHLKGMYVRHFEILSTSGKRMLSGNLRSENEQFIDVANLAHGTYVIEVECSAGEASARFIKE